MNNKIPITMFCDPDVANELYLLAKQAGIETIKPEPKTESDVNKSNDITFAHKFVMLKASALEEKHNKPKESKQTEDNVKNEFLKLIKTRNGV